jgi:hypothetical protein
MAFSATGMAYLQLSLVEDFSVSPCAFALATKQAGVGSGWKYGFPDAVDSWRANASGSGANIRVTLPGQDDGGESKAQKRALRGAI